MRDRAVQLASLLAERVAPLPQVGDVRQHGLMVGIELAPPTDGLRWGRRVSAACVERGVLIRPLGDVVVIMPILTSTADEIERIVDVVADSIACAATIRPGTTRLGRRRGQRRHPARGRWRTIRTLDEGTPATHVSESGQPVVTLRVQRLPRPDASTRRWSPQAATRSTVTAAAPARPG